MGSFFLTRMPSAEQTQNCDKEKWIDALSRSTDNSRMEYCETPKRNDDVQSRSTRTQAWCQHQFNFIFFETKDTVELQRAHVPHEAALPTTNQSQRMVSGQEG